MNVNARSENARTKSRWKSARRIVAAVATGGLAFQFQSATCETRLRDAVVESAQTVFLNTLFHADAFLGAVDDRFATDEMMDESAADADTADQP